MEKKDGFDVDGLKFGTNGEVTGLSDDLLEQISAGVGAATDGEENTDINVPCNTTNSSQCACTKGSEQVEA